MDQYHPAYFTFDDVPLPTNALVNSARLKFLPTEGFFLDGMSRQTQDGEVDLVISAHCSPDSEEPDTCSTTPKTATTVDWQIAENWYGGEAYLSEDFACVLQELVDRPGWASGNTVTIFLCAGPRLPEDVEHKYRQVDWGTTQLELWWSTHEEYEANGGLQVGGGADYHVTHHYTSSGGLTVGGEADAGLDHSYTMAGGLLVAGNADNGITGGGGVVLGGVAAALLGHSFAASGGLRIGGTARIRQRDALYRRLIRIPANTVAEDLVSFPVFVYHEDLLDQDDVSFESPSGDILPFEQRANAVYVVKIDVTAEANTDFYVYYGDLT